VPNPPAQSGRLVKPGAALKAFRTERGLTLAELSQRTGLQPSTLSKIENGKIETTIDKLVRISAALGVNIADLFGSPTEPAAAAPLSRIRMITRAGEGKAIETPRALYSYPAFDLLSKSITPLIVEVRARSLEEFGPYHRHAGEEFVYVLEGELAFYSDTYMPAYLKQGDNVYFDSGMGHAYVAVGDQPCRILCVFTTPEDQPIDFIEDTTETPAAPPVAPPRSQGKLATKPTSRPRKSGKS
jgi:transcriptional regulator with XRE-family HTH domain